MMARRVVITIEATSNCPYEALRREYRRNWGNAYWWTTTHQVRVRVIKSNGKRGDAEMPKKQSNPKAKSKPGKRK